MSLPEFTVVSKESSVWSANSHDFKILMISGHVSASYIFNKYKRYTRACMTDVLS